MSSEPKINTCRCTLDLRPKLAANRDVRTILRRCACVWSTVQEVVSQDANIFTKLWSKAQPKRKTYLYRYLTDQAIWQSPRFWSAAFFFAVQRERANKPTASWLIFFFFYAFEVWCNLVTSAKAGTFLRWILFISEWRSWYVSIPQYRWLKTRKPSWRKGERATAGHVWISCISLLHDQSYLG